MFAISDVEDVAWVCIRVYPELVCACMKTKGVHLLDCAHRIVCVKGTAEALHALHRTLGRGIWSSRSYCHIERE